MVNFKDTHLNVGQALAITKGFRQSTNVLLLQCFNFILQTSKVSNVRKRRQSNTWYSGSMYEYVSITLNIIRRFLAIFWL